ncbi:3-oxoacyl-reductase [Trametopsis cervina]|nr:3-oxoacyl-reductase [Trametopsis cervina]
MSETKNATSYGATLYNAVKVDGQEFRDRTLARLKSIQGHLDKTPRSGRLHGKVCIITGVGSLKGIGRASALLFAHAGAKHLYLLDFDGTNLPELKTTIESRFSDVKATVVQGDAADEETIAQLCKRALQEEGRLDVFFANAGVATIDPLEKVTTEQFMRVMRINTLSCFLAIKYGSNAMLKTNPSRGKEHTGGSIILTASIAGIRSGAGSLDYSASKAAVNNMAHTAPYQLRNTDIRVNSICPGIIETGMTEPTFTYAAARGTTYKVGQLNAQGRWGVAEEIGNTALFLASDDSSYVNGQNLAVDGGLSASHPVAAGRWA